MRDGEAFTLPLRLFLVRLFPPRLILCSRCPWMIDFCALFFPPSRFLPVHLLPCTVYTVQLSIPARSFSALLIRARILLIRFLPGHMIPATLFLHFYRNHHVPCVILPARLFSSRRSQHIPRVHYNLIPNRLFINNIELHCSRLCVSVSCASIE